VKGIKPIITLLLLAVFAAPTLYIVGFQIRQHQIHAEMKERLEKDLMQTISLERGKIKWVKKEKELLIDNRLFDVKDIQLTSDGRILITGLYDNEESLLVQQFQKNQQQDNSSKKQLGQLFQIILAMPESNRDNEVAHLLVKPFFPYNCDKINSVFKKILTPPPQA